MFNTAHNVSSSLIVLLALAACGGGGGSTPDGKSSTSGSAGTASSTASATVNTTVNSNSSSAASGSQEGTPAQTRAADDPASAVATGVITANGVLADVLARVLVTTNSTPGGKFARPGYARSVPWEGDFPGGAAAQPARYPMVSTWQYAGSAVGWRHEPLQSAYQYYTASFINPEDLNYFAFHDVAFDVGLSAGKAELDKAGSAAAGSALMTVGPRAQVSVAENSQHVPNRPYEVFTIPQGLVLKKGERLAFDQPLAQWKGASDQQVTLLLKKGGSDDQVQVCLDSALTRAKRLDCSVWQIPSGWQVDQALTFVGQYVRDDRSFYPGGSGHLQWFAPNGGKGEVLSTPATAPISAQGVSNDVLSTIFDSWRKPNLPNRAITPDYATARNAAGDEIPAPAGSPSSLQIAGDVTGPDPVQAADAPYAPTTGPYELRMVVGGHAGVNEGIVNELDGFRKLEFNTEVAADWDSRGLFALFSTMKVKVAGGDAITMRAAGSLRANGGALIPFGVLNSWYGRFGDDANHVVLSLQATGQADQAKLCWKAGVSGVDRTLCLTYQVPADWKRGQPLPVVGYHVTEGGKLYWGAGTF